MENANLEITYVTGDTIQPHPQNPREGDVGAISQSIEHNGVYRPVIVQKSTGYILAGNHTYKAMQALGINRIPTVQIDCDDQRAKRIMLADNRTADLGTYDDTMLLDLLQEVDILEGTGYDGDNIDELLANLSAPIADIDGDETPEPPQTPTTKPGDVWNCGPHRVVCGDATRGETYQLLLQNETPDMIWTDPPYGVEYEGKTADKLTIENDGKDGLEPLLTETFLQLARVARPGAPTYIAYATASRRAFENACETAGIRIRQELVWVKNQMVLGRSDYQWRHEPIMYGFTPGGEGRLGRGGPRWYGDNTQTTVFEIDKPQANSAHPTMKPVDLIAPMIKNSCRPRGMIIDPFGGSGSTMLAAEQTGRIARLIELDPKYVDVICRRYEEATGKTPIHATTGQPFTPAEN